VFSTGTVPRSYKKDNWGNQVSSVQASVKKGSVGRELPLGEDLSAEAEESPLFRSRYQGTAAEDKAGWKRLSGCCSYL
jgi:hypothetical protein